MEKSDFSCFWRIENFILVERGSYVRLDSPEFTPNIFSCECHLRIYDYYEDLKLFFSVSFLNSPNRYLKYSIILMTAKGWIIVAENRKGLLENNNDVLGSHLVNWDQLEDEAWNYLPSGCLTVGFHLWEDDVNSALKSEQCLIVSRMQLRSLELLHKPIVCTTNLNEKDLLYFLSSYEFKKDNQLAKSTQTDILHDSQGLLEQDDLVKIYLKKQLGFATLHTPEKELKIHKAFLCAGSPVFQSMFEKDVGENVIDMADIDNETIDLLMSYFHMESLNISKWYVAVNVYYAADKYQIEPLKKRCISDMANGLVSQNICEAFVFADLHQVEDLKQSALQYFSENLATVLKSKEWKKLLFEKQELVIKILKESADKL